MIWASVGTLVGVATLGIIMGKLMQKQDNTTESLGHLHKENAEINAKIDNLLKVFNGIQDALRNHEERIKKIEKKLDL